MSGVDELIAQIDLFLSDESNKTNKRLMIELYHQAFPLNEPPDINCPGCVLKCWGKLLNLKTKEYKELINHYKLNPFNMSENQKPETKYEFAPEFKNAEIFIPELHINGLAESELTDTMGDVLTTYQKGKYSFYVKLKDTKKKSTSTTTEQ